MFLEWYGRDFLESLYTSCVKRKPRQFILVHLRSANYKFRSVAMIVTPNAPFWDNISETTLAV